MIDYKFEIEKMQVAQDNLVIMVYWKATAIDDVNNLTTFITGVKRVKAGDTFTPYNELTQEQVTKWCFEDKFYEWTDHENNIRVINHDLKKSIEDQLKEKINQQLEMKKIEPELPWKTL